MSMRKKNYRYRIKLQQKYPPSNFCVLYSIYTLAYVITLIFRRCAALNLPLTKLENLIPDTLQNAYYIAALRSVLVPIVSIEVINIGSGFRTDDNDLIGLADPKGLSFERCNIPVNCEILH